MWARNEEDCVWMHTLTTSAKTHGLLAPARRVGLKPAICGVASAQGVYEPGSRRRLLASGRFKANQPVIMAGTGHYPETICKSLRKNNGLDPPRHRQKPKPNVHHAIVVLASNQYRRNSLDNKNRGSRGTETTGKCAQGGLQRQGGKIHDE